MVDGLWFMGILNLMKLILNVSFAPHFVALFDADDQPLDILEWDDFRSGGQKVWDFLGTHKIGNGLDLTFIGGVSGPGGFSTLRVGGAILNALAHRFDLPVHQARADLIARELIGSDDVVLNSFGDGVFIPDGTDLKRVPVTEVSKEKPLFIDWLPEDKKSKFKNLKSKKEFITTTLQVLEQQNPTKVFLPDYEYPAVS